MFMHVVTDHAVRAKGASELMEEYMDASNFGVCKIILFLKYFIEQRISIFSLLFILLYRCVFLATVFLILSSTE